MLVASVLFVPVKTVSMGGALQARILAVYRTTLI